MKIISIISICVLISSCALGVGVYSAGIKTQDWNHVCVRRDASKQACDDKISILKKIGKPNLVENTNGSEVWKYRTGLKYVGFAPVITLIPIPVMIPVGFRYSYVYFDKDNVITNANKEFNCQKNFMYLGLWITDDVQEFGFFMPRNSGTC